jgi:hypothetical protein
LGFKDAHGSDRFWWVMEEIGSHGCTGWVLFVRCFVFCFGDGRGHDFGWLNCRFEWIVFDLGKVEG